MKYGLYLCLWTDGRQRFLDVEVSSSVYTILGLPHYTRKKDP